MPLCLQLFRWAISGLSLRCWSCQCQKTQTRHQVRSMQNPKGQREMRAAKDVRLCRSLAVRGGRWNALRRGEKTELKWTELNNEKMYHRIRSLEASNRFQMDWPCLASLHPVRSNDCLLLRCIKHLCRSKLKWFEPCTHCGGHPDCLKLVAPDTLWKPSFDLKCWMSLVEHWFCMILWLNVQMHLLEHAWIISDVVALWISLDIFGFLI